MALFKRATGVCLALLLSAIFWANAGGARHGQNVFPRSLESCRTCHQAIVDSFVQTAHSKTSARAGASSIIGEGKGAFSSEQNLLRTRTEGVYFRMERRGADFYQNAVDASKNRSRTERFEIAIGSGRKGQSYLFWKDGLLFQLPASYLTGIEKWINSPGYVDGQINFER